MNLETTYLGLHLRTPLVVSASPFTKDASNIPRLEDAGASAIVFHSLFEEQIRARTCAEGPDGLPAGVDAYADRIARAKEDVRIPIIASLNGNSFGCWTSFSRRLEQAGADALELNLYHVPTDPDQSAEDIEQHYLSIVAAVAAQVKIPIAIKLSPYFTNLGHFARRLVHHGARGLVLFNRFYQPDIALDSLSVTPEIHLSSSSETLLPLRWIAILHGRLACSLAATSGIHTGADALKLLLAGADATMLCSTLLAHGLGQIRVIEREILKWMDENACPSLDSIRGSLSQQHVSDPSAFERALYLHGLSSFPIPTKT